MFMPGPKCCPANEFESGGIISSYEGPHLDFASNCPIVSAPLQGVPATPAVAEGTMPQPRLVPQTGSPPEAPLKPYMPKD